MLLIDAIESHENEFNARLWTDENDVIYNAADIEEEEGREEGIEPQCILSDEVIECAEHDYTLLSGEVDESERELFDVVLCDVFGTDIVTRECKEIAALIICAGDSDAFGNEWILKALPFNPRGMELIEAQEKCEEVLSDFFGVINQAAIGPDDSIIAAEFSQNTGRGFLHIFNCFGDWYYTQTDSAHGIPLESPDIVNVLSRYATEYAPRVRTED